MIWRQGWIEARILGKMDDNPVQATPNHHPPKMACPSKTFLKIILAAKSLVQHSGTSRNHQRRPLPSLLCDSYSMIVPLNCNHRISNAEWNQSGCCQLRVNRLCCLHPEDRGGLHRMSYSCLPRWPRHAQVFSRGEILEGKANVVYVCLWLEHFPIFYHSN